jgi:hypothetical protein
MPRLPLSSYMKYVEDTDPRGSSDDPSGISDVLRFPGGAGIAGAGHMALGAGIIDFKTRTKATLPDAPDQVGGTCYANAAAMAITDAEQRIVGRKPDFAAVRAELIKKFGYHGAAVSDALAFACRSRRLRWEEIPIRKVREALAAQRAPVMRFELSDSQWAEFSAFFKQNKKGVLCFGKHISTIGTGKIGGHAVCVQDYDPDTGSLQLMNSWGKDFADDGYFRMSFEHLLPKTHFYDVFFVSGDLPATELAAFRSAAPPAVAEANAKALATLGRGYSNANGLFQTDICSALRSAMAYTRANPSVVQAAYKWPWSSWIADWGSEVVVAVYDSADGGSWITFNGSGRASYTFKPW